MEKKNKNEKKIMICLYIIIALLVLNTIVLLAKTGIIKSTSSNNNTQVSEEENADYDVSDFEEIDAEEFMDLSKKDDTSVIYLGRSTCAYCVKFLPSLKKAQEELGYKTYYVDITKYDSSSDGYEDMTNLINSMTESYNNKNQTDYESIYGYTPTVAILSGGSIKDIWVGYGEYDTFKNFLNENGIN